MLSDYISPYNATVIDRLEDQDAIVIGKLNMVEFKRGTISKIVLAMGPICSKEFE